MKFLKSISHILFVFIAVYLASNIESLRETHRTALTTGTVIGYIYGLIAEWSRT